MRRSCTRALGLFTMLILVGAPVFAQTITATLGPVPVSPGAARRPTLATACPAFNWAPAERAVGYELAVHRWLDGQLGTEPVMRTTVPGRTAGWTPAASECLETGATYLWFVREVDAETQPVGDWSAGLAFTVVDDSPSASDGSEPRKPAETPGPRSRASRHDMIVTDKPPVTPPAAPPGQSNDSIKETLDIINAKLDDLLSPASFDVCAELGGEAEIHTAFGGSLDGEFEGRVGAEGFGNGVMGKIKAKPGWDFGAQIKGAFVPKLVFCYDLLSIGAASMSTARTTRVAALKGTATTFSSEELTDRLLALVGKLNLDGDKLSAAIDLMPNLGGGADPWSALRSGGPVSQLADVMPMPAQLRTALQDPAQVIAGFRAQLALCSQTNLPQVIGDLIGEFCGLANNERFSRLLDRVDGAVSNVKGVVDDILGQLPVSGNCKFFCKD